MFKHGVRLLAAVLASMTLSVGVAAQTFTEVGDAGNTPATAQTVPASTTRIEGNLQAAGDVDVYRLTLSAPGLITMDAWGLDCDIDANLILMDAARLPLWGNDDGDPNHCLGSRIALDLPAGTYYLAFGDNNIEALDADGNWLCGNDEDGDCALITTPVDRFSASGSDVGPYVITFSRATGGAAGTVAAVPGPVGLVLLPLLLAVGWMGSRTLRRRA